MSAKTPRMSPREARLWFALARVRSTTTAFTEREAPDALREIRTIVDDVTIDELDRVAKKVGFYQTDMAEKEAHA